MTRVYGHSSREQARGTGFHQISLCCVTFHNYGFGCCASNYVLVDIQRCFDCQKHIIQFSRCQSSIKQLQELDEHHKYFKYASLVLVHRHVHNPFIWRLSFILREEIFQYPVIIILETIR